MFAKRDKPCYAFVRSFCFANANVEHLDTFPIVNFLVILLSHAYSAVRQIVPQNQFSLFACPQTEVKCRENFVADEQKHPEYVNEALISSVASNSVKVCVKFSLFFLQHQLPPQRLNALLNMRTEVP